ncbi:hypothetical protein KIN20_000764 [Parelaphostrongylus tenuis]|uniref:Uncharacterized protein n=1 Tax=Parelaphostrongylus tenuis TaxID=148309 RepID=A0AAD5QGD1_PARTN|nr:hypothetical protein KIN20_000764 [Parelaphostrongylus tenuis]
MERERKKQLVITSVQVRLPKCQLVLARLLNDGLQSKDGLKTAPRLEKCRMNSARTRSFTVTGFTLPVKMVYSADATVRAKAFGIAASADAIQTLASRLVMQTIFDVLEQQSRSALLPDAITPATLHQLIVQITYEPLEFKDVAKDITNLSMMCKFSNSVPPFESAIITLKRAR